MHCLMQSIHASAHTAVVTVSRRLAQLPEQSETTHPWPETSQHWCLVVSELMKPVWRDTVMPLCFFPLQKRLLCPKRRIRLNLHL